MTGSSEPIGLGSSRFLCTAGISWQAEQPARCPGRRRRNTLAFSGQGHAPSRHTRRNFPVRSGLAVWGLYSPLVTSLHRVRAPCPLGLAAILTPLWRVGVALLTKELLFTCAEGKFTSAVGAGDSLILIIAQ